MSGEDLDRHFSLTKWRERFTFYGVGRFIEHTSSVASFDLSARVAVAKILLENRDGHRNLGEEILYSVALRGRRARKRLLLFLLIQRVTV
jgi:hypothetical protein